MDADEWVDDAMFHEAVGLDTTVHEKFTLSRQLKRGSGAGWTIGGKTEVKYNRFFVGNGYLYCMVSRDSPTDTGDSRLYKYEPDRGVRGPAVTMPGSSFFVRAMAWFDGKLFIGGRQTSGTDVARLYWTDDLPGDITPTWHTVSNPAGITDYGGHRDARLQHQVVRRLRQLHLAVEGRRRHLGRRHGLLQDQPELREQRTSSAMEVHLGFLYMLSANGHLHRTDGNNTFDIWSWDGNTTGVSLRSYDGKLFVGTYEWTDTPTSATACSTSSRAPRSLNSSGGATPGKATTIGRMTTYARKLYYGASSLLGVRGGFGIAVYDAVEDAHSIFAINDSDRHVPRLRRQGHRLDCR